MKYINNAIGRRKEIDAAYRERLKWVKGIRCLNDTEEKVANYAYFPILIEANYSRTRDDVYQKLKDQGIHPRRYFYPLISDFPMYRGLPSAHSDNLPVATIAAQQVLCLPIYPDLEMSVVDEISSFIAAQ